MGLAKGLNQLDSDLARYLQTRHGFLVVFAALSAVGTAFIAIAWIAVSPVLGIVWAVIAVTVVVLGLHRRRVRRARSN